MLYYEFCKACFASPLLSVVFFCLNFQNCVLSQETVQTLMKLHFLWHFILVTIVYRSTCLQALQISNQQRDSDFFSILFQNSMPSFENSVDPDQLASNEAS